jgi:hypothetical protein
MNSDIMYIGENKMNIQKDTQKEIEQKIGQILYQARQEGETYLITLSPEQLKKSGFEEDDEFFNFEFVEIYVLYDDQFKLKYVFDGDPTNTFYESKEDVGGFKYFIEILKTYLSFRQY